MFGVSIVKTSKLKELQASAAQALLDPLTQIANRAGMKKWLGDLGPRASLKIALFDLNGLKKVNDTQGHGAGDKMILQAAARIKAAGDPYDSCVARLGGDEFVLIELNPMVAWFDHRVRTAAAEISSSVGVAEDISVRDFSFGLKKADERMYLNKQQMCQGVSEAESYVTPDNNMTTKGDFWSNVEARVRENVSDQSGSDQEYLEEVLDGALELVAAHRDGSDFKVDHYWNMSVDLCNEAIYAEKKESGRL